LQSSHADTRPACGLHSHDLWQSHANADGNSNGNTNGDSCRISNTNGDSHSISDCNGYGNSNSHSDCNCDCAAEVYTDTEASPHAAASPVGVTS
jgi:hypothetical protein